ncbi:hypothetical protein GCM10009087_20700 [Sphingomonas oligophenolica]|uniref:Secreted protein n=1 Tax=Sphingomonas oligophenolica TaxID=301154 RepID=A0ABU9Y3Y3_9SPHN
MRGKGVPGDTATRGLTARAERPLKLAALVGALAIAGGSAPAADPKRASTPIASALPAPPANGEMGYVLTAFAPAIYQGKDDCPDGLANTVQENYLQSLPALERARLLLKPNEPELTRRWKAYAVGPDNTNVCANPELFDHPMLKTIQGKVAPGLDLDGKANGAGAGGCSHDNFVSPAGERGIDNQAYRALGCSRSYRGVDGSAGDVVRGYNNFLATGEHSMVLLLRGVDSLVNDDDVEIVFATTGDRPILDSQRNFITGASYSVSDNPRWRNVLHGRIVNGVLTTDPHDVHLTRKVGHGGIRGENLEWQFRQGRFRLAFQPDGSVKGLFGGYQPVRNVIEMTTLGGIGAATVAGIDCSAELKTLEKMADGMRDPKTGQCTAISAALDVSAVPAFVTDRPATTMAGN